MSSVILGIHIGHDASASLLVDGVPRLCISEERLVRVKSISSFPFAAVNCIMHRTGMSYRDVDVFALDTRDMLASVPLYELRSRLTPLGVRRAAWHYASRIESAIAAIIGDHTASEEVLHRSAAKGQQLLARRLGTKAKVQWFDHHVCHALSAFDSSPFEHAVVITSDAKGDGLSATAGSATRATYQRRCEVSALDSVGQFYGAVTAHLGFLPNRHEGKVMGLAALGDSAALGPHFLAPLRWRTDGSYTFGVPSVNGFSDMTDLLFHLARTHGLRNAIYLKSARHPELRQYRANWLRNMAYLNRVAGAAEPADVAAAAQVLLETATLGLLKGQLRPEPTPVVVAGGVFSNVLLNTALREIENVEDVYVQPAMGDEGLSLGAAFAAWRETRARNAVDTRSHVGHTYLGMEYDDSDIHLACKAAGIEPLRMSESDIAGYAAGMLASGAVLGLFQGAMEFGPRALGNRSILLDATKASRIKELNARLARSDLMPFAPCILGEYASRYLVNYKRYHSAQSHMTVCYHATEAARRDMPGAVHVDGTLRAQVVWPSIAPRLHRLLSRYEQITRVGGVINTSMNRHEEPIVCAPADAIRLYAQGVIDVLVMQTFVLASAQYDLGRRSTR